MHQLPRAGFGVLVVVIGTLFLSACAGGCRGEECQNKFAMLTAATEANAAGVSANRAAIADNEDGDAELRRLAERAMAMAEQNRAALRSLSEKIDRMFATMSRK